MNRCCVRWSTGGQPVSRAGRRLLAALAAGATWLTACGPGHPTQRGGRDSDDDFTRFVRRVYFADDPAPIEAFHEVWS